MKIKEIKSKCDKFCDWCIESEKLHVVMVRIFCIAVGFTVVSWAINAISIL